MELLGSLQCLEISSIYLLVCRFEVGYLLFSFDTYLMGYFLVCLKKFFLVSFGLCMTVIS